MGRCNVRWVIVWLLISVVGCASQAPGPQTGGIRLPNCHVNVYGKHPTFGCHTGGMTIPVGR
jgi:hypothetical protein